MVAYTKQFKRVSDNVNDALDNLREMLVNIDSETVGGRKIKNRIRSVLLKLEKIKEELEM